MKRVLISVNFIAELPDNADLDSLVCISDPKDLSFGDYKDNYHQVVSEFTTEVVEEIIDNDDIE